MILDIPVSRAQRLPNAIQVRLAIQRAWQTSRLHSPGDQIPHGRTTQGCRQNYRNNDPRHLSGISHGSSFSNVF
jgi:hypothetical protein